MKRIIKSFIMLFAALFVYGAAGAQTTQTMEEQKEMKELLIKEKQLILIALK